MCMVASVLSICRYSFDIFCVFSHLQVSSKHARNFWKSSWIRQTALGFEYLLRTTAVRPCGKRPSFIHSSTLKTLRGWKNSALLASKMWSHCWKAMKFRQAVIVYLLVFSLSFATFLLEHWVTNNDIHRCCSRLCISHLSQFQQSLQVLLHHTWFVIEVQYADIAKQTFSLSVQH